MAITGFVHTFIYFGCVHMLVLQMLNDCRLVQVVQLIRQCGTLWSEQVDSGCVVCCALGGYNVWLYHSAGILTCLTLTPSLTVEYSSSVEFDLLF